jgi:ABC-type multidrug transport system fused ATPase/permease subunit
MHLTGLLFEFFKSKPMMVSTNLMFMGLTPIQDIVLPHYYGKLIDSISLNKDLTKPMIVVIVLFTILEIGYVLSDYHDIATYSSFQTFTRRHILKNLMDEDKQSFSDLYVGEIMSKVVKVPYTIIIWYERMKYYICPYIIVFMLAVLYFFRNDKVLGLSMFILTVSYLFIVLGVPHVFCQNISKEKDQAVNIIHEEMDDILRNFIAVHGDKDKQEKEIQRLQYYEDIFTYKFASTMKCLLKTEVMTSIILITFVASFIIRCKMLLKQKSMKTSAFVSMFLIILYLCNAMMTLEDQLREQIFDWGIISESDSLFQKLKPKRAMLNIGRAHFFVPKQPGIGMRDVSFTFPGGHEPLLKNITFHVNKGETVLLLGDVGSGKSTILKLLLQFNKPDSGTLYLDGKPYDVIDMKEFNRKIGYVPQQPILFNRSVMENIRYGNERVSKDRVRMLIRQLNLENEFVNLEDGLETKVGKNGSKLSGGQRQIVWCLRTIIKNPEILILDEPTASLDEKYRRMIKHILTVMMKNKTVIVVTHDSKIMDIADRKIYIENGVVKQK